MPFDILRPSDKANAERNFEVKSTLLVVASIGLAFAATGANGVALVEDGVAKCRVVVAEDAHPALKFGAREIAKYLGVATGAKVEVNGGGAGLLPVTVRLANDSEKAALKADGFTIDATPGGVTIVGANPRGALYGCYDVLKKYAGMRWIMPGDDAEYCVLKGRTVRVPLGRRTVNPYLKVRTTRGDNEDSWLWHARNNMTGEIHRHRYADPKTGKPTALAAREFQAVSTAVAAGVICMRSKNINRVCRRSGFVMLRYCFSCSSVLNMKSKPLFL